MSRSSSVLSGCCLLTACAQTVTSGVALPDAGSPLDAPVATADAPIVTTDAGAPVDAGSPVVPDGGVSDDCRRGTWCWERPFPTGEAAVAAVAPAADRMAYVTEGGTLARWEGGRWSSQLLTLPGQATGIWLGADGEVVLTVVERLSQRERWIVELRGATQRVTPVAGQGYVSDPVAAGDTLWVKGTRELYRRRAGGAWETIDGPGDDAIVASMHVVGPDEVIALESWGSGSGTGLLHRYRAGTWELAVDFRGRPYRVDGPIVLHDGSLWMRNAETDTGRPGMVRVTGAEVVDVRLPRGLESASVHQVGTDLWVVGGNRAWRRRGEEWSEVEGFPGRLYGELVGFGDGVAWALSAGVQRWQGGAWERLAEADQPTGNFWDLGGGDPVLVAQRPAGFFRLQGMPRQSWEAEATMAPGDVTGDSAPVEGVGALATEEGVVLTRGTVPQRGFAWPTRGPRQLLGASPAGVWAWESADRFIGAGDDGMWIEVTGPVFEDVPRGGYTVDAVHFTADARLFVAASLITGDKQVRRRAFVREGAGWRTIASEMGVFGRTESSFFAGDRSDALWIGLSALYRYDGRTASRVTPELQIQGLSRRTDGAAVVLTPEAVEVYGADGRRTDRVTLPPVRAAFARVHQVAATRVLRVANASGHVMRYTP